MELYEELFIRDNKITALTQQNYELTQQRLTLTNTVETLVRVKCKRGESNICLNTDLVTCLSTNKTNLTIDRIVEMGNTHKREPDLVASLILSVLIGDDKQSVPCVLLDSHTVLYRRFDTYSASNVDEFALIVYEAIQDQVSVMISLFQTQEIQNVPMVVNVLNILMQESSFTECFRKALKKYTNA